MDLYRPLVLSWCVRQGVQAEDAADVAQEDIKAAAAALGTFHRDRPGDTIRGWLRGITRNQVLMHFRRNQGQPRAEGGSAARLDRKTSPSPQPTRRTGEAAEVNQLYRRALEYVRCRVLRSVFGEHSGFRPGSMKAARRRMWPSSWG